MEHIYSFMSEIISSPNNGICYVTNKNEIIGTGQVYIDNNKVALIQSIGVKNEFRLQGIGTDLMLACIDYARKHNAELITLYASDMGKHVYEKLGFKVIRNWFLSIY